MQYEKLALKQEKYCSKCKLGIDNKVTNTLHTQRIGHIAEVNMRTLSEKWCLNAHRNKEGIYVFTGT